MPKQLRVTKTLSSLWTERALTAVNYWLENISQEETESAEYLDMVDLKTYLESQRV